MPLKKNDFIEIEFTGRLKDTGQVFDSNIVEELKKSGLEKKEQVIKPFVFSLGQGMFLQGIDEFLTGKEIGEYTLELSPEKAFGIRQTQLIQLIPMKIFREHNLNPIPGISLSFDGRIGKILSASGGRVRVDFNHPLSGKTLIYDIKVLRKIEDLNEKISSFLNFLFRRDFKFEIKSDKIILEVEKSLVEFVKLFEEKFKDIFSRGLEVKEAIENAEKTIKSQVEKETLKEIQEVSKNANIAE